MSEKINKKDMTHLAGSIYNFNLDAEFVTDVLNEHNEPLKYCYNISTKTLCILDYKKAYSEITVKYIKHAA